MIWAKHLIAETEQTRVSRDRTGTDDLLVELAIEAGERLVRGAGEAEAAITLAVGDRRWFATALVGLSGTGVDRRGTTLQGRSGKAERTHHEPIRLAVRVHIADVLLLGRGREVELEADAVTLQDIALAVGDTVVDEAAGGRAESISLVLAHDERGFGYERRILVERDGRYRREHVNGYHYGDGCGQPTCNAHPVISSCAPRHIDQDTHGHNALSALHPPAPGRRSVPPDRAPTTSSATLNQS
jgi:hypothetical protein